MTKNENTQGFSTRAIHAGQSPDPSTGAIMTPIYQSTTFVQTSPGVHQGYEYARAQNPTRTALEANIAALEGGKHGVCFSSGCGAMDAVVHLLKSGDHVVLSDDVYGGTFRLFDKIYKQMGIDYSLVDLTDMSSVESAVKPNTRMLWLETPSNPLLKILDIRGLAQIARKRDLISVVDNTFASPYLQRPLELDIDISLHSSTKYLGGHSDVIGGAIIVNDDSLAEKLHFVQKSVGAVPSPFECFLLLRSTKTLAVRMERHCDNAEQVAKYLAGRSEIERVLYPGLAQHPGHALAKSQMTRFGGMITIILSGGLARSRKFLESVKLFSLAESLGGVESLIEHPAIMTHASIPKEQREKSGILDGLIRLSVGIEDVDDLIRDLEQALA